jgi:hypothetical protein
MRFYLDALAELGLAPLAAAPLDVRIHRALFFPAFRPHACVTVTQYQDLVELHVAVRDAPDLRVDIAPPSPPLDDTRHPTLDDGNSRDGVALYGELSIAGALHTFSANNAEPGTPQRAYFLALLALARPHAPALAAIDFYL